MYYRACALFVCIIFIGVLATQNVTAAVWQDSVQSISARKLGELSRQWDGSTCPTFRTKVDITSVGTMNACMYGGYKSIVTFQDDTGTSIAASVYPGEKRYPVRGVCGSMLCTYAPRTDTAVQRDFGQYPQQQLTVSRDIAKSLELRFDARTLQPYFQYIPRTPPQVIVDADGQPTNSYAAAFSENGRWLGIELFNEGTGLVDMHTLKVQRITDQKHRHGYGFDPTQEIAVSDDGSAVIVAGRNAGFNLIVVSKGCGDAWQRSLSGSYSPSVTPCPQSDVGIGYLVGFASIYYRPHFVGNTARVYAQTNTGSTYVQITPTKNSARSVPYLALGDSFTSGEGDTDDAHYVAGTNEKLERCHLSSRSYPYLLTTSVSRSVACSGARIHDVVNNGNYRGQNERMAQISESSSLQTDAIASFIPGRIPQADFVRAYQPDIVTIGIGGNDVGLMEKLTSCIAKTTCSWAKADQLEKTALEIRGMYSKLVELYSQIQASSPLSRLFVIGYPDAMTANRACSGEVGVLLNTEERAYFRHTLHYINEIIETAARSAGATYVDIGTAFGQHGLCGNNSDPAMNGIRFGGEVAPIKIFPGIALIGSESFHPTPLGHRLIANAIIAKTAGLTNFSCGASCATALSPPKPDTYWNVSQKPTRAIRVDMTEALHTAPSRLIKIRLDSSLFARKQLLTFSIDSDAESQDIQTISIEKDFRLEIDVRLASNLEPGFYTVHLECESVEGEKIDVYQQIRVDDVESIDNTHSSKKEGVTEQNSKPVPNVSIGQLMSEKANGPSPKTYDRPPALVQEESKKEFLIQILIIAGAAAGIIGTCLILVRLLRK